MCKLCNTDRKPCYPKEQNTNKESFTQEFRTLANDYIGENPCRVCCTYYITSLSKYNMNAEDFILRKLLYSYTQANTRRSISLNQYYREVTNAENVGKNITKKTNIKTGTFYYVVCFKKKINKKSVTVFNKNTKTLEEAIEVRDNYLKGVN